MSRLHALVICGVAGAVATATVGTLSACGTGTYPNAAHPTPRTQIQPRASTTDGRWVKPSALPKELHRYGFLIGAIDAISATIFAGSIAAEGPNGQETTAATYLRLTGLLGYGFASPILHRVNDNTWGAGGSFLLRTTMPLLSALVGEFLYGCGVEFNDTCDRAGPRGMAVGAILATILDATFLARRWRPIRTEKATGLRFQPVAIIKDGQRIFGLGGRF